MTTHLKTIEYVFPALTGSLAASTTNTFSAITLTVPETTGRSFQSAHVVVSAWDADTANTQTLNAAPTIGCTLGAASTSNQTVAVDTTNTPGFGANFYQAYYELDYTSYFNTNFGAGTTQTCSVSVKFPNTPTTNICVKVVLTYQYDDSNTTRAKTVRIPLDGYTGFLPTSLTQIGGSAEVPNLSTFCPESSKTFLNVWFEVAALRYNQSNASFNMTYALDSETGDPDGTCRATLTSNADNGGYYFAYVRNDMATNASHAFKMKTSVANTVANPCAVLCATYTYDHAASTSILNSLVMAMQAWDGPTDAAIPSTFRSPLSVQETNPVLVQSAIQATYNSDANTVPLGGPWTDQATLTIGNQTSGRQFAQVWSFAGNPMGQVPIQSRFDVSGSAGLGFNLIRGFNVLSASITHTQEVPIVYHSAVAFLNYTSAKHTLGDGVHNHTIRQLYVPTTCLTTTNSYVSSSVPTPVSFPESNYYLSDIDVHVVQNSNTHTGWGSVSIRPGEFAGSGHQILVPQALISSNRVELLPRDFTPLHIHYPGDPNTDRIDFSKSRTVKMMSPWTGDAYMSVSIYMTYHAITYAISGSVSGYTGDGSGITVTAHRADTGEQILSTTTAVSGTYAMTWYDNNTLLFTEARQDNMHMGRSDNVYAS